MEDEHPVQSKSLDANHDPAEPSGTSLEATVIATTPADPVGFLKSQLLAYIRNDLATVAEARCPTHGTRGSSASFTTCLLCCITCEVLAELLAPLGATHSAEKRRAFYRHLGQLVDDPRYAVLGEIVHRGFRNGIAHAFLPMVTLDVGCATVWLKEPTGDASRCVEELVANPRELRIARGEWHLVFDRDTLTVVPQVFYLDVRAALDEFEAKLTSGDLATTAALGRNFPEWWDSTTAFKNALPKPEREVLAGHTAVPVLRMYDYWTLSNKMDTVNAWLERSPGEWVLVVEEHSKPQERTPYLSREEADEQADMVERNLGRQGYLF